MNLSTRNRISGTVSRLDIGEVMASVTVRLRGGQEMTAAVTRESVEELGLAEGSPVQVLVKSTEVALATGSVDGLSIRNRLPGTVTAVSPGAVMTSVKVAVPGATLTAVVTGDAVTDLGITVGSPVTALVKATEVSLASMR
ncbi:TOBE domain-containing protein [Streptomyces meridianus]|uniref:TOBE domain-containing protein n=1 Tax=Streptomyces meridianus TaxID=2938945 RepID=A0ABT0X3T1_9ACTN|nr:TOBE domain-containing protein [Streptomyces meridianus]MCM2577197.1 TOBE domain-containing protein [Streptomyces meridianus]